MYACRHVGFLKITNLLMRSLVRRLARIRGFLRLPLIRAVTLARISRKEVLSAFFISHFRGDPDAHESLYQARHCHTTYNNQPLIDSYAGARREAFAALRESSF